MAAKDTLNHSSTYRENNQEEHASEAKHLQYAVENQEDWSRSDPGIRFTDELKKISDKAATAFDNGQSLTNYSDEELDHIVDSYLAAWSKLDFRIRHRPQGRSGRHGSQGIRTHGQPTGVRPKPP